MILPVAILLLAGLAFGLGVAIACAAWSERKGIAALPFGIMGGSVALALFVACVVLSIAAWRLWP